MRHHSSCAGHIRRFSPSGGVRQHFHHIDIGRTISNRSHQGAAYGHASTKAVEGVSNGRDQQHLRQGNEMRPSKRKTPYSRLSPNRGSE